MSVAHIIMLYIEYLLFCRFGALLFVRVASSGGEVLMATIDAVGYLFIAAGGGGAVRWDQEVETGG